MGRRKAKLPKTKRLTKSRPLTASPVITDQNIRLHPKTIDLGLEWTNMYSLFLSYPKDRQSENPCNPNWSVVVSRHTQYVRTTVETETTGVSVGTDRTVTTYLRRGTRNRGILG